MLFSDPTIKDKLVVNEIFITTVLHCFIIHSRYFMEISDFRWPVITPENYTHQFHTNTLQFQNIYKDSAL